MDVANQHHWLMALVHFLSMEMVGPTDECKRVGAIHSFVWNTDEYDKVYLSGIRELVAG